MSASAPNRTRRAKDGTASTPVSARKHASAAVAPPALDAEDRRLEILEIAAELFARKGYRATSVREIADRAGLLAGSLYYHIRSKEALFVEIHDKALEAAATRIRDAVEGLKDPWKRLEAACLVMLDIRLNPASLTLPIMNNLRTVPVEIRDALIHQRDKFEKIFHQLVDDLPLSPDIDPKLYRIFLLSLLNSTDGWYRDGRLSRADIAAQIIRIFRHEAA